MGKKKWRNTGRMSQRWTNVFNTCIMLGVIVPPAWNMWYLSKTCGTTDKSEISSWDIALEPARWMQLWLQPEAACEMYRHHPVVYVNVVHFCVVDVGFYLVYLLQNSTWLIDPHWQLIPMSITMFWYTHPDASAADARHPRAQLTMALVMLWGVRLLHNYFRREEWNVGKFEDWRYADMRRAHGKAWIVTQFFAVSVAQHGMLVGLTMPLQSSMALSSASLNWVDGLALFVCLLGIFIGWLSDNQLREYMLKKDRPLLLDTGMWKYSRHPNHFGEQTWWVGLLLFSVAATGTWWPSCIGVLYNHPLDTFVTLPLIEERMMRRPERAALFKRYQECTSLILPLPWRRQDTAKSD